MHVVIALAVLMGAAPDAPTDAWQRWIAARPAPAEFRATWNVDRSAVRSAHGVLLAPEKGEPLARANALLAELRPVLGVGSSSLRYDETRGTTRRSAVRFVQTLDGLDVVGGEVVVSVRADGAVVGFESAIQRLATDVTPRVISARDALDRAHDLLGRAAPASARVEAVTPEIFPAGSVAVHAWRVPLNALPHGLFEVHVRADDGSILWVRNLSSHVGTAGVRR